MANVNTSISAPVAPITTAANTSSEFVGTLANGNPAVIAVAPNSVLSGRPFKVRLTGEYTVGATSTTFKPQFRLGTSSTAASNTAIATPTAVSTNTASVLSSNFIVEAEMIWDVTSTQLNGTFNSLIYNTLGTSALITQTTSVTALGNGGTTGLNFVPTFTFSAASTSNSVTVLDFAIEQL